MKNKAFLIGFVAGILALLPFLELGKSNKGERIESLYSEYLVRLSEFTFGGFLYNPTKMNWRLAHYQYLFGTDIQKLTGPELEAHMKKAIEYHKEISQILPTFYQQPQTNMAIIRRNLSKEIKEFNLSSGKRLKNRDSDSIHSWKTGGEIKDLFDESPVVSITQKPKRKRKGL